MDKFITTSELTCLLARIANHEYLSPDDLQTLDNASQIIADPLPCSSEIANYTNQIWLLLQNQSQSYWTTIGTILQASRNLSTKQLALNSMAQRIASEGSNLDPNIKRQLLQFVIGLQEQVIFDETKITLKLMTCEVFISLMRIQWKQRILHQYVESIANDLVSTPTPKLLYFLQVIKRIIREGYQTWPTTFTTDQLRQFKICLEDQIRPIMKIICYCILDCQDKIKLIPECLRFIKEVVGQIPAFEVFNCNLIQALLMLLEQKQFQACALSCLKEIFEFQESEERNQQHAKIAKKLFGVLQRLLGRYLEYNEQRERQRARTLSNFDKRSGSTRDSLFSQTTINPHDRRGVLAGNQLLELLYLYLNRYVPFMDISKEERSLQIEVGHSTKLFFSRQLYEHFQSHFWKLATFLNLFSKELGSNLITKPERDIQRDYIFAISVKLMLELSLKLKIGFNPILYDFFEMIILNITPLPKAFKRFYGILQLIHDRDRTCVQEQVRLISDEYVQNFIEILKLVSHNKLYAGKYYETIQKLAEQISENSQEYTERSTITSMVNIINRIAWTVVALYDIGSEVVPAQKYNIFVGSYVKFSLISKTPQMKRAFANNCKYIVQIGKVSQNVEILLSALKQGNDELHREFVLVILSKIFLRPNFKTTDISKDLNGNEPILMKLSEEIKNISLDGFHSEEFPKIYPGIFSYIQKMFELNSELKAMGEVSKIGKKVLKELLYSQLEAIIKKIQPNNLHDLPLLKCLNDYMLILQNIGAHLIDLFGCRQNSERGSFWLLKHHYKQISWICCEYLQYRYKLYSQECNSPITFQNFEIQQINDFRQRYHVLLIQQLQMVTIWYEIQKNAKRQKVDDLKAQWMQIFQHADQRLAQDFQDQPEFKCQGYLTFTIQWLKSTKAMKCKDSPDILNTKIKFITKVLNQENLSQIEAFTLSRLSFWREVISNFIFELDPENIQEIITIFRAMCQGTTSQIQLCLEMIEVLFHKIQQSNTKKSTAWLYIISFFQTTFEHFFRIEIKQQQLFKRLGHIFFTEMLILANSQLQLESSYRRYTNIEIMHLKLKAHIESHVAGQLRAEYHQKHCEMLEMIFKERNESNFIDRIRDYRVNLEKWLNSAPQYPLSQ